MNRIFYSNLQVFHDAKANGDKKQSFFSAEITLGRRQENA